MHEKLKLQIEYIPIEQLIPYDKNTKIHNEKNVEYIKNSIREFGMSDPIGIWSDKNIIVEGHGRLMALKELGYTEAPCIRLDHMSNAERRAYAMAHNKTAESSEWDYELTESEIEEISKDFDMSDFGFDPQISPSEFGEEFSLPDGEKPEMCTMSFQVHEEQKALIEYALSCVKDNITETFGNTNKNGNALYEVIRQWAEQKK